MDFKENRPVKFYKKIYISHGFGGKEENKKIVEDKIKKLRE